jgi:cyclopropane fatty-acyl-phospholipid synthase-like methyltransferase
MLAAAMAAKKALFDKKSLALTRAKLRAWWEGEVFDQDAALAEIEAKLAAAPPANDIEDELFDELPYELPPRLQALALLWGEDRCRPGDATADKLEPARIGLAPEGVLAVLGPGLAGPMIAVAAAHPGKIDVFEWREETFEALQHGLKQAKLADRISAARIDLEAHVFTPGAYDGLLSIDDFAYCGYPPHLAQQIMKCLKPGASAVVECYVGFKSPELATAFASSFAEPQIRAHGDVLQFFVDAGLALEADEDMTDDFLFTARAAFKQLGGRLAETGGLEVAVARELAWETEAWRMRLQLLATRRLERRRFILRKPADGVAAVDPPAQAENTNAPAG